MALHGHNRRQSIFSNTHKSGKTRKDAIKRSKDNVSKRKKQKQE